MLGYNEKISCLADLIIKQKGPNFVLSGAGISTESGIPDYRSPGSGLWAKVDPIKAASLSTFLKEPSAFYGTNLGMWKKYSCAEPNKAHRALAVMEKEGFIVGVITQNIDGLHIRAGSKKVWEVHGHLRTCRCIKCQMKYPMSDLIAKFEGGEAPPLCRQCREILRPDVVLFGDHMNNDFRKAKKALTGCQTLIVVGSSLQVYPVAGLPEFSRHLVIINREPTHWDKRADLVINESIGKVFGDLLTKLGLSRYL